MKKPNKKEIKNGIVFFLLCYLCVMGFFYTYALICYKIGVPFIWAILACIILAFLSTAGLFTWATKKKKGA